MIGILAYGSLLADPGWEIEEATQRVIEGVMTPFEVEFARKSSGRANAPTLVPVPNGWGSRVRGDVLVLKQDISQQQAMNILYRREIDRVGKCDKPYREPSTPTEKSVLVRGICCFQGLEKVFYALLAANLTDFFKKAHSDDERAQRLARLALDSLTRKTFFRCRDGIRYLADAIAHRIETPLTKPYRKAILAMVDDAPDLETARIWVAKREDILEKEEE